MTAKKLTDVLQRVEAWPEAAQAELAGVDRGLKAAREGRVATTEQVERLFDKHRPA